MYSADVKGLIRDISLQADEEWSSPVIAREVKGQSPANQSAVRKVNKLVSFWQTNMRAMFAESI